MAIEIQGKNGSAIISGGGGGSSSTVNGLTNPTIVGGENITVDTDPNTNQIEVSATNSGVTSFNGRTGSVTPQPGDYTAEQVSAVPTSRTINSKPLTDNIVLSASDVSARPDIWLPTPEDINAVPITRTVNGLELTSNIWLTPPIIGAASNINLLDNWYLVDPINQRGETSYNVSGYVFDRWKCNGKHHVQITSNGITLPSSFYQLIESKRLNGQTATLSILTDVDCGLWMNFGNISGEAQGKMHIITGKSTDTDEVIRGCFFNSAVGNSDEIHVIGGKLEIGSVQTLAHKDASGNWVLNDPPPNKALELAKCQRYQYVLKDIYTPIGTFISRANNSASILAKIPNMRVKPTIILQNTIRILTPTTLFYASAPITTNYVSEEQGQITFAIDAVGTQQGNFGWVDTGENGSIIFDANL